MVRLPDFEPEQVQSTQKRVLRLTYFICRRVQSLINPEMGHSSFKGYTRGKRLWFLSTVNSPYLPLKSRSDSPFSKKV
jgi:hypothetical protein